MIYDCGVTRKLSNIKIDVPSIKITTFNSVLYLSNTKSAFVDVIRMDPDI